MSRSHQKAPAVNRTHEQYPSTGVATSEEVMAFLRISRTTLYDQAKSGAIPAVKIGGGWWFSWEAIRRHMGMD